ncbi:hypothetical protein CSIRO_2174 [Bradyrhizobiaceae bacterium SG-6C]|nr:hypothetical protein CSIRO_2174 [Bradyrhizobiaceae bacterium SG-6C]
MGQFFVTALVFLPVGHCLTCLEPNAAAPVMMIPPLKLSEF